MVETGRVEGTEEEAQGVDALRARIAELDRFQKSIGALVLWDIAPSWDVLSPEQQKLAREAIRWVVQQAREGEAQPKVSEAVELTERYERREP